MNDQDYDDARNDRISSLMLVIFFIALAVLYHVVSNIDLIPELN